MKKIILLVLISLSVFADIKVTTLETKAVNYENGEIGAPTFRILCINGYQWLQSGSGNTKTLSQMFENCYTMSAPVATAIKCQNK